MYVNNSFFKTCTKLTAICLILQFFVGFASSTNYYVSTEGNNSNDGLTLNTAWATPSYAATKAVAGDVVYLTNGTWYEEKICFVNNGTSKKPIIIKAFNRTPTLDGIAGAASSSDRGLDISNNENIIIRGLKLLNYTHPLYIGYSNNISVYDCEFSNSRGGVAVVISSTDTYHTLIDNCSIHDSGWNAIQIQGNREVPYGNGIASEYITITNNTIYDNNAHNQIDLFGNVKHVLIKDNLIYNSTYNGIYSHSITDNQWNVTIENNTIYNCSSGIKFENLHDSNIIRNQIYNMKVYGIYTGIESDNITFCENNISSKDLAFQVGDSNQRLVKNKLNDNAVYRFNNNGTFTLQDAVNDNYTLILTDGVSTTVEYTTNQVFTVNASNSAEVSNISYKCDKSYLTIKSNLNGTCSANIRKYPFYVSPTKYPLNVVSTNNKSIRIHSNSTENPVWISVSLPEYSNDCMIMLVDGVPYKSKPANSEGFVSFNYNDTWETDHLFAFETVRSYIRSQKFQHNKDT